MRGLKSHFHAVLNFNAQASIMVSATLLLHKQQCFFMLFKKELISDFHETLCRASFPSMRLHGGLKDYKMTQTVLAHLLLRLLLRLFICSHRLAIYLLHTARFSHALICLLAH